MDECVAPAAPKAPEEALKIHIWLLREEFIEKTISKLIRMKYLDTNEYGVWLYEVLNDTKTEIDGVVPPATVACEVNRIWYVLYAFVFCGTMIFVSLASWRVIEAPSCVAFSICTAICGIVTMFVCCRLPENDTSSPPEVKEKLLLS